MIAEYENLRSRANETPIQFIIPAGGVTSNAVYCQRMGLTRLSIAGLPAGTVVVSWLVADDEENRGDTPTAWRDLYRVDGATLAEVVVPVTASRSIALPTDPYSRGFFWLKARSGPTGAPVSATAAITIGAVMRPG